MYEVELKVEAGHETIRRRLDECGGSRGETVRQVDTYYNAPDRDFAQTDEALRIREQSTPAKPESDVFLTYKGPLVDSTSKTREEAETAVADVDSMDDILSGLGYVAAATVRKDRERYALEDCVVTLDSVDGLGEYVEVEYDGAGGITEEADIDDARERVRALLGRLNIDPDTHIQESYLELLLE